MGLITIVNGVYKATNITGGGHIAQLIQLKNTKRIPLMWVKH